jgi:hypothetical protein
MECGLPTPFRLFLIYTITNEKEDKMKDKVVIITGANKGIGKEAQTNR